MTTDCVDRWMTGRLILMVGQLCGYAEGQIDSGDDETLCE